MSIVLKYETGYISDAITLADATGDYDGISNPGGFGTPNPDRSMFNQLDVTVTWPDNSTKTIDLLTDIWSDTGLAYDFSKTNKYAELNESDLGASLPDGVYSLEFDGQFTLTMSTVENFNFTQNHLHLYHTDCYLSKLALDDSNVELFMQKKAIYDRILYAFSCGNVTLAQSLIDDIGASETDDDCGCGC